MFPDIIVWPDAAALYLIQLKPTNISAGGADTFTFSFSAPSAFLFSLYFFFALPIFPSLLPAYISCRAKLRVAARIYFLVRQEGGREDIPACLITLYPTNASPPSPPPPPPTPPTTIHIFILETGYLGGEAFAYQIRKLNFEFYFDLKRKAPGLNSIRREILAAGNFHFELGNCRGAKLRQYSK